MKPRPAIQTSPVPANRDHIKRCSWPFGLLARGALVLMLCLPFEAAAGDTPAFARQAQAITLPARTIAGQGVHRHGGRQGRVGIPAPNATISGCCPTATCSSTPATACRGHADKEVVFEYQSASEIYACQRLPNGNTFIGECNAGRLLEVEPSGKVVKEIRLLPEGKDGGHLYMRNARRLANGHYLVAHYGDDVVREYDRERQDGPGDPGAGRSA